MVSSCGHGGGQGFGQAGGGFLLLAELGFEVVEEGHQVVDLGDDAFLLREDWQNYWESCEAASCRVRYASPRVEARQVARLVSNAKLIA